MVWTDTTSRQYDRSSLCYASDCTDEEWGLVLSVKPIRGFDIYLLTVVMPDQI